MAEPARVAFDEDEWGFLRRAVRAMSNGDEVGFGEESRHMGRRGGYSDRLVVYVRFALQYQSVKLCQLNLRRYIDNNSDQIVAWLQDMDAKRSERSS